MRGFVDQISSSIVSGWVFDPQAALHRIQVRITLGDKVLAEGIANRPRPDVGRKLGIRGANGFRFADLDLSAADAARLVVEARSLPGSPWTRVRRRPGLRVALRRASGAPVPVTVVGTSHLAALSRALPPDQDRFEIVHLNRPRPGLPPACAARWRETDTNCVASFRATLDRGGHFVSMLGGNDHNALGLIEHPQRFDLLEPGEEVAGIEAGRDLVPYGAVRALLEQRLDPYLRWLAELAPAFAGRKLHLCSPPPVPSAEHIRSFPGVSADRLHRGVTPARIRAKLHRIHSDIIEQRCATLGVEFLSPPAEAADAEGFLKPAYWNQDPTHANRAYGALLLKQIEERLAA